MTESRGADDGQPGDARSGPRSVPPSSVPDSISNGRNGNGRFAKGWRGGPGNPRLARLAEAQDAVRKAATPKQVRAVLAALHAAALKGDTTAARVWLDRVLGRPQEMPIELHHVAIGEPVGPPVPQDLGRYLLELNEIAGQLGLIPPGRDADDDDDDAPDDVVPSTEPPQRNGSP